MCQKVISFKKTLYACYLGYISQAIVNNYIPLLFLILQRQFGLPLRLITLITTVNFSVQLLVDFLSARFIDRIGYRVSVVAAHVLTALGLVGMGTLPFFFKNAYMGILISVVVYAMGGGLIEVLISPIVEACPTDHKASSMSLLHAFYSWGTVFVITMSTLFLAVFGKGSWRVLTMLWAILPAVNTVFFLTVPIKALTEEGEGMTIGDLAGSSFFWIFLLLMIAAGAAEEGMNQWASAFAENGLKVSKAIGDIAGPCLFAFLMGSTRTWYCAFGKDRDLLGLIKKSALLCVLAYLLAVFSPIPALAFAGLGLGGFSVAIMWPGVFSLASAKIPKGGTALFALLALGGDAGSGGGPTVVGMIASLSGDSLKTGLLSAAVFPVSVLLLCLFLEKRPLKRENPFVCK